MLKTVILQFSYFWRRALKMTQNVRFYVPIAIKATKILGKLQNHRIMWKMYWWRTPNYVCPFSYSTQCISNSWCCSKINEKAQEKQLNSPLNNSILLHKIQQVTTVVACAWFVYLCWTKNWMNVLLGKISSVTPLFFSSKDFFSQL